MNQYNLAELILLTIETQHNFLKTPTNLAGFNNEDYQKLGTQTKVLFEKLWEILLEDSKTTFITKPILAENNKPQTKEVQEAEYLTPPVRKNVDNYSINNYLSTSDMMDLFYNKQKKLTLIQILDKLPKKEANYKRRSIAHQINYLWNTSSTKEQKQKEQYFTTRHTILYPREDFDNWFAFVVLNNLNFFADSKEYWMFPTVNWDMSSNQPQS